MNMDEKSRRVILRLKMPLYEFLLDYSKYTKRTLSDVIRIAIEDYYQRLFLGKLTPDTRQIRKEFMKRFGTKKSMFETLKKNPIRLREFS